MRFSEIIESFRQSFDAIKTNKLRSFLASLGVVIGISFVILMGWFIAALDKALEETFNLVGVDMLYVDQWDWAGGRNWKLYEARKPITLKQADELKERLQSAEFVIPVARRWMTSIAYEGEELSGIGTEGTRWEYGLTPGGTVIQGRFFNEAEENRGADVVVLGFGVNKTFFPDSNGIGKTVKLNGRKYQVIGVVKKQSTILMDFIDNTVYIPIKSFLSNFGYLRRSISIAVKAGSKEKLDDVRAETIGQMRIIRNLKPYQDDDFSINETKAFESSAETLRLYVWGIGIGLTVLSFVVGIIGIMNIMFVSVAERTKEIGIRKAIGAKKSNIMLQFLIEAAVLCLAGAIIAFVFCSMLTYLTATFLPNVVPSFSFLSPFIPLNLLFIASFVSIIVGVLAGLMPAFRAAKLDPVDALRYE